MGLTLQQAPPESRSYTLSTSVLSLGMPSRDYLSKRKMTDFLLPGWINHCPSAFPVFRSPLSISALLPTEAFTVGWGL